MPSVACKKKKHFGFANQDERQFLKNFLQSVESVGGSEQRCQHCIVDITDRGLIGHLQHRLNEFLRQKMWCSHLSL